MCLIGVGLLIKCGLAKAGSPESRFLKDYGDYDFQQMKGMGFVGRRLNDAKQALVYAGYDHVPEGGFHVEIDTTRNKADTNTLEFFSKTHAMNEEERRQLLSMVDEAEGFVKMRIHKLVVDVHGNVFVGVSDVGNSLVQLRPGFEISPECKKYIAWKKEGWMHLKGAGCYITAVESGSESPETAQ